jgi:hypothetical protein
VNGSFKSSIPYKHAGGKCKLANNYPVFYKRAGFCVLSDQDDGNSRKAKKNERSCMKSILDVKLDPDKVYEAIAEGVLIEPFGE